MASSVETIKTGLLPILSIAMPPIMEPIMLANKFADGTKLRLISLHPSMQPSFLINSGYDRYCRDSELMVWE